MPRSTSPSFSMIQILLFFFLLCFSAPLNAGDPHSSYYCTETDRLIWFIHASDCHIGSSGSKDSNNLNWLTGLARDVINPSFIVVSGDLTDSTDGNILGWPDGPHQEEWDQYRSILSANGIDAAIYFDIPGNHDAFNDQDFSYYLANSVQGRATGRIQASWARNGPWGKYHFLGVNTAGNEGAPFSIFWPYGDQAGLDSSELSFISAEMAANQDADLTLVFGHHPLVPTGNDNDTYLFYGKDEFVSLMNGYGVTLYGYGHTHATADTFFNRDMTDGVFYFNVSSLGKDSPNQYKLTAIDCNGISSVTRTVGAWPVLVITAPMDMRLGGIANPYAYTVTNGASNPIRALVFDPTAVSQVQFRVNGGTWLPMESVSGNSRLWQGSWDASALTEGEYTVEVQTTTGSGVSTDAVTTYVGVGSVSGRLLTVSKAGNGSGTVTSDPAGISCPAACSHSFPLGGTVNMSYMPGIGSLFADWSGACTGIGYCSLEMDSNRSVIATFDAPPPARIGATFYQSLQSAYDHAAPSGDVIMLKEGMQAGPFTADADKSVTIRGGYNPTYSGAGAETVIDGGMMLGLGSVVFDGVGLK